MVITYSVGHELLSMEWAANLIRNQLVTPITATLLLYQLACVYFIELHWLDRYDGSESKVKINLTSLEHLGSVS